MLAGGSLRSIVADWNARGVRSVRGGDWTNHTLRRVLTSARIAGLRSYRGEVVADAAWPAIVDRSTHERLQAILLDPNRNARPGPARRYLLTGFGLCGLCGVRLVARPRDDKRRCYVCAGGANNRGCGKIRVLADPLEELVAEAVIVALSSPAFARALEETRAEPSGPDVIEDLRADEDALEQLATDHYADRRISRREFMAARRVLEDRIDAARRMLVVGSDSAILAEVPSSSKALRRWWEAADIDSRRSLLSTVVDTVTVGPAVRGRNRFDSERVSISWRA